MDEKLKDVSVLELLLKPELPDVRKVLPEKAFKVDRLSELAGEPVVFTLRALSYDQVRTVQEKPRGDQAAYGVLYGCVSPKWGDAALLDSSRGIATPIDAIKARLISGEIDELYMEIQKLSGYLRRTISDVKNG